MIFKNMKLEKEMFVVGLFYAMLAFAVNGCASSQFKVKNIETEVESKHGGVGNATVVVDKEGNGMIQEEIEASNELRIQVWKNSDIRSVLNYEYEALKECVARVEDPRLGWNGAEVVIPEMDSLVATPSTKEEFGRTETGDLKVVRKTAFIERLKSERALETSLVSATKTVNKRRLQCERDYRIALIKAGFPAPEKTSQDYDHLEATLAQQRH